MISPDIRMSTVKRIQDSIRGQIGQRTPKHITEMNSQIAPLVGNFLIVALDQSFHHLIHRDKRTITEFNNVVMPVVLIKSDKDVAQITPILEPEKSVNAKGFEPLLFADYSLGTCHGFANFLLVEDSTKC